MIRFRRDLLNKLTTENWKVTAIADYSDLDVDLIRSWGMTPVSLKVDGSGTNPLRVRPESLIA